VKKLVIDMGGTFLRSEVYSSTEVIFETLSSYEVGLLSYIDRVMCLHPETTFIGISYAGQVENGVILSSPNLIIDEPEIQKTVQSRYGVRLEIDNDLNCAIRAEAAYWQSENIAALYIGTGIGAAVIDAGRLVQGSRNMAFEIGHIPYQESPLLCGCGRSNCLELFVSGSGMAKWLKHYGSEQPPNLRRFNDSPSERTIASQFEEGFLYAAGTLVTLANPELLILGGGIITENPYLLSLLKENLKNYALKPSLQGLRIEMSVLENAPLIGAKLLENDHE